MRTLDIGDLILADFHKELLAFWEDDNGFAYRELLPAAKIKEIEEIYAASLELATWLALDLTGYTLTHPENLDWLDCIFVKWQEDGGDWYGYVFKDGLLIDKGWVNVDEEQPVEWKPVND